MTLSVGPVKLMLCKALDKREPFAIGSTVWVRRSDSGSIEPHEVLGLIFLTTNVVPFRMHYLVVPNEVRNAPQPIRRRVVPWHHVFASYGDALDAGTMKPPPGDPLDEDLAMAVAYRRMQLSRNP